MTILKDLKLEDIIYQKTSSKISTYQWKYFYNQPIDSDIKWYEKITKLTTSEGEHCTSGCLLDYDYFKRFR